MDYLPKRRTPLGLGVALALGISVSTPASAQEAAGPVEEVIATGIRKSLSQSRDLKKDSQGVVDGIISEDIGKFPDTNLAESLQRITGVSIDRSEIGEGQSITVRGVGPDFNLVLLNGRQMPASAIEATDVSNSRAFDFANLASESVSAVEIFKTSRASIPTGGIGATVNIRTARPFDNTSGERVLSVGAKGVYDDSTRDGDRLTPEISGIYSETFADDKFGITLAASYQDRNLGYSQAYVDGWRAFGGDEGGWGSIPQPGDPGSENITNRPDANDVYSVPQALRYTFNEVQRERTNGQLAMQFRPMDTVTATLDYTYSENQLATQRNEVSAWFNFGPSSSEWTDGPVAAPLVYSESIDCNGPFDGCSDLGFAGGEYATVNENNSIGLNLQWDATDRLGLAFDFHDSDAETRADSPFGSNAVLGAAVITRGDTTADFSSDFPVLSIELPPGQTVIDPANALGTGRSFRNSFMRSEIRQFDISGDFSLTDESSLDFGVTSTEVDNRTAYAFVEVANWGGEGTPDDYPDSLWQLEEIAPLFDNMDGVSASLFPNYFDFNFQDLRDAGIALVGSDETFTAPTEFTTDRRVNEDSFAAYVQYNQTFFLGDMPANIALGLRYEETDVESSALVPIATGIIWTGNNEFQLQFGDPDFTTLTGSYDYVLPSLDFDVEVVESVIARASYSESIGRPGWGNIQGGQTLTGIRIDGGNGEQGDPGLLPLESKNIDLSVEWYYGPQSYVSVGYFQKDIDNYVGTGTIEETPFDLPHPAQGDRFAEAVAAVGATGTSDADLTAIRNYIFENYGDTPEVTITGTDPAGNFQGTIQGIVGEDPAATFAIVVPSNQRSAELDGWEIAVQHMFGDTGFGVAANATFADSNLSYDNTDTGDQFAIEGLSDSANLIGIFENDQWGVRVAYNWRDEFLSDRAVDFFGNNPQYTESYGQWDLNVNFVANDNLTVFFEGINVTDEVQRIIGRNSNQPYFVTQTGARFMLGARYKFY